MVKKLSEAEKSAHVTGKYSTKNAIIGGLFLIGVVIITWWLNKSGIKGKESQVQKVEKQTADNSGSISNYNAGRDVKIENVSYNTVVPKELPTVKEKQNIQGPIIIYKDRPQQKKENSKDVSKNQIVNNTPNQGVQINENNGTIIQENTNNYFQSEYKPLNKTIEDEVAKNLALLIKKYPLHHRIQIDIEAGNNQRRKIALSLSRLLGDKNLGHYPEGRVTVGNYPGYPITVRTKPENEIFISEFMKALRPFIIGEYAIFKDPNMGSDGGPEVIFYLNGMPIFDANGVVKIE